MTQDQTSGREPVPSFTPISETRADAPRQTEFRLVSPAPPETEPDPGPDLGSATTGPTTPAPTVPSQARRTAADARARHEDAWGAGDLADGEELMAGAGEDEPPAHDRVDEELRPARADDELLPSGTDEDEPLADDRADEELLPSGAGHDQPAARGGLDDDEPLLSGLEELCAGWQRVRIAFVDNPRGAVAEAAGLTDEAAEALAAALRERRHRIRASWEGNGSGRDTEALRLALLRYQALFSKIVGGLAHGARVR